MAPMVDWTDRHYRYFARLITRHALLYTEMLTTGAIIHGDRDYVLGFEAFESPVALQLGGSDPSDLAKAVEIAEPYGYAEFNLNCGCPSPRVSAGNFGASLMFEPDLVAECVKAMQSVTDKPVTVKCRIGVDDQDEYQALQNFVEKVHNAGVDTFIVHARKAWLAGLSPKENREIPPLNYERVYQLKHEMPNLEIIINGGIKDAVVWSDHRDIVDGVMVGREAYQNPYHLADVDRLIYNDDQPVLSRREIVEAMVPYIERNLKGATKLGHIVKHMLGLYQGVPGARAFRRSLSEHMHQKGANADVLINALKLVESND